MEDGTAQARGLDGAEVLCGVRQQRRTRRLLRAIAKGEEITQDVSTLENPAILDQLKQAV